ncbi:HAD-like domain-containing protein [Gongronella butleri]|nr:HAD-like domain-containing protein [Gongronella butleri]
MTIKSSIEHISRRLSTTGASRERQQSLKLHKQLQIVSESYVKAVETKSVKVDEPTKRQLVILDLNGTLVSRTAKSASLYARPGHKAFFDYLFKHFAVMVWSSAQPHNVDKMCRIFGDHRDQLELEWTRMDFGLSHADYRRKVITLKDLERVWKALPRFNYSNTILIDDSTQKAVLQPFNHLCIREFDHQWEEMRVKGDNELDKVQIYLERIFQESNVSNYIFRHPYDSASDDLNKLAPKPSTICTHYAFAPDGGPDPAPVPYDLAARRPRRAPSGAKPKVKNVDDLADQLKQVTL